MIAILVFVVSMVVSSLVYPLALGYAKRHNIVDNPNARKLQRVPIPVMGGLVVYLGILSGSLVLQAFEHASLIWWGLSTMTVMLFIGMWDDLKSLSAGFRFLVEIILVGVFIWQTEIYIDDLHGLLGIHQLEPWVAVTLSIVVGVGLINVTNLIDGVDGYSSGYGMLASVCFAVLFWSVWSHVMVCMALIVVAALLPFFMHNVFGVRSKMFIGDGGTLMLGMMMTLFVFYGLSSKGRCASLENDGVGLVALGFAIISIPWFDTMRVVFMRILRGKSPFRPDKTHMHHLFIDMGFSHLGAAISILVMNLTVVLAWLVSWLLGASIDVQTYVSIGLGVFMTFVFYNVMKVQQNSGPRDEEGYPQGTALWHWFCHLGALSHREKGSIWRNLRWLMDSRFLSRHYVNFFCRL
jgi:UDP-N-acetylmuramyl pentapeptide phosphotransferase/UDP-N-acetylglucosamine-1-phosphate transferase